MPLQKVKLLYLNRPLKLIELRRKKMFTLDFKIEANTANKTEFLNMSRSETTFLH
jgi:hypothetical protein